MKPTNYTVCLMKRGKGKEPDELVAEMEVEGSTRGPAETARHYADHARMWMRHIRFDYATAR